MTTLTIKFNGVQEEVLDRIVASGLAETKSEAVRMAVLTFAIKTGLFDDRAFIEHVRRTLEENPLSVEETLKRIEDVKNARVSGQQRDDNRVRQKGIK
jgi:hypothetical protein